MRADNGMRMPAFLLMAAVTTTFLTGFCHGADSTVEGRNNTMDVTTESNFTSTPKDHSHLEKLVSDADFDLWIFIGCLCSGVGLVVTGVVLICIHRGACSGKQVRRSSNPYLIGQTGQNPTPHPGNVPQIFIERPSLGGRGRQIPVPIKVGDNRRPSAGFRGQQPPVDSTGRRRPSADPGPRRYSASSGKGGGGYRKGSHSYSADGQSQGSKRPRPRRKKRPPPEDDSPKETIVDDWAELASETSSTFTGSITSDVSGYHITDAISPSPTK